jgi:hypothetical protein
VPLSGFFSYIVKQTLPILLPVFALVRFLFISGWVF